MKMVCFSDTHYTPPKLDLPEADIAVCAGDVCFKGKEAEYRSFIDWYEKQPIKHKILVPGNHDWFTEDKTDFAKSIAKSHGVILLINDLIEVDGIKIYGTPVQPFFCDWAWNYHYPNARDAYFSQIPEGIDVLVTHCPPFGILDETPPSSWNNNEGEHVGDQVLAKHVWRAKPRFHVFGHIHHSYGIMYKYGTKFINAAICTEQYTPDNPPIVVDLDEVDNNIVPLSDDLDKMVEQVISENQELFDRLALDD
jgi:Icc-related predicted phosphoesterase